MNLFGCCRKRSIEKEIIFTITQKHRSESQGKNKKIFIKRQACKHPIIDPQPKPHQNSTVKTSEENGSNQRINDISNKIQSISTIDFIHNDHSNQCVNIEEENRSFTTSISTIKARRQINKFINFKDILEDRAQIINKKGYQQFVQKQYVPLQKYYLCYRPVFQRKINKIKEDVGIHVTSAANRSCINVTKIKNEIFTIDLDTIQEKQSQLPSDQNSQIYQMGPNQSKSTLNPTNKGQLFVSKFSSSNFDKYDSMVTYKIDYKPILRSNHSESLLSIQHKSDKEFDNLLLSRLQMDNKILSVQLKGLVKQQNFLKQQRQFNYKNYTEQTQRLQFTKNVLKRNVDDRQKDVLNMKDSRKIKQNNKKE